MTWFAFSLISVFALAIAELLQQHLLNESMEVDEKISLVLTFTMQAILALPIIFISGLGSQFFSVFEPQNIFYLLISTITASIGMVFYLRSFKVQNISISTMFISFSAVVSTLLGIIFLHESINPIKFLGILLIIGAIISLNFRNRNIEKNHLYGILAGIFFGSTYMFDKLVVLDIPPIIYLFWSFVIVTFVTFIQKPMLFVKSLTKISGIDYRNMFISGAGYFAYNLCTFTAYTRGGEIGRIDAINNSQIFLIILAEYFILKQKDQIARKLLTAMCAFVGIYLLGNF